MLHMVAEGEEVWNAHMQKQGCGNLRAEKSTLGKREEKQRQQQPTMAALSIKQSEG